MTLTPMLIAAATQLPFGVSASSVTVTVPAANSESIAFDFQAKIVREVAPYVYVDASGHLRKDDVKLRGARLSPQGTLLLASSLVNFNTLVDTGEFVPTRDGRLFSKQASLLANGNWFRHYWYGYDAGISHDRIESMTNIIGIGSIAIPPLLKRWGWKVPAAINGAAVYLMIYWVWIWSVDQIGGRRGITLTATWPNCYMPLVWYQK